MRKHLINSMGKFYFPGVFKYVNVVRVKGGLALKGHDNSGQARVREPTLLL